ncbi:flavodoxin-dependent (E)-4-hydroxy-3-methylbut-2-enyl-diphosphate synthase, partial [Alistipes putredinis]|uniref:flavodoxin-dependent (E)-4-hydroxy-3-methylbut-2-enyl-diphosphate synthase n=1 Tax=Alistipes putredinis TaxID=28117 RepID=UPI003AB5F740
NQRQKFSAQILGRHWLYRRLRKARSVAVMGCVVNGPGEAREADIGIAGGKGEAVLFIHGKPIKKLTGDNILDQFMDEIYKL